MTTENSISVHVGDDAPISDNLRSALNGLIQALEESGMAPAGEVEGFAQRGFAQISVGSTRPGKASGPRPEQYGCIGYEFTDGEDSCWIHWGL